MKIQIKTGIRGTWAKAGLDLKDGDVVEILDAGQTDTSGNFGPKQVFKISTKGGEKNLSLNQTSLNNLGKAYGDETENWVNKKAKVFVIKQMVGDGLKNVVYLAHPKAEMDDEGHFSEGHVEEVENIPF